MYGTTDSAKCEAAMFHSSLIVKHESRENGEYEERAN